jgi:hypothetical protein
LAAGDGLELIYLDFNLASLADITGACFLATFDLLIELTVLAGLFKALHLIDCFFYFF